MIVYLKRKLLFVNFCYIGVKHKTNLFSLVFHYKA